MSLQRRRSELDGQIGSSAIDFGAAQKDSSLHDFVDRIEFLSWTSLVEWDT